MPEPHPTGSDPTANGEGSSANPAPRVVIVGASVRAAAFSAIRAGLQPICFDQFADLDLQRFALATAVEHYPQDVAKHLQELEALPVIYTGAMENHASVLGEIAARQPVLGNDAETLAAVRDPVQVHEVLRSAHVPMLEVRTEDDPPAADGTWLLKPRKGSGGRGITVWDEDAAQSPTLKEPHYFQQRAEGQTISAVYVAAQDPFQLKYVGLTRQFIGVADLNAPPFAWCGSIGPVALDTRGEILCRRIGTVLAHKFGLRGLFGCDFITDENDEPLLVEVNPRYTASVEILELLCGSTLFSDHCRVSGLELPTDLDARPSVVPSDSIVGKAVLYSNRTLLAPDTTTWQHVSPWQPLPGFADIPQPGSVIKQGSPVCTIFAAATTFAVCEEHLMQSAASVRELLAGCQDA